MKKTMRKDFEAEIEIPEGVEASIEAGNILVMKKGPNELRRSIDEELAISKEGSKIRLSVKKARKNEKRRFGTIKSHIRNMIDGLSNGFEYELEICNVHFPMTVSFDKAKKEFIIKNILGEKSPRTVPVPGDVEVEIKAPHIKIKSHSLEDAGQAAANLEKITKIRYRDRNKFQDGIFITKKPGRSFL